MSKQILSTAPGLLLHSPHTWCFGQIPVQMKSGQDLLSLSHWETHQASNRTGHSWVNKKKTSGLEKT